MNTLYYGDCLTIMREKMQPQSIDLVYLDPPFNSQRDYNAIYKDETGRPLPDQVEAYTDTWLLNADAVRAIRQIPFLLSEHGLNGHAASLLSSFLSGLAHLQPDMAAYLAYMTERLVWIRRMMKPTASIYLHCDSTANYMLRTVMDVVFGHRNFRSDITWKRTARGFKGSQHKARTYNTNTDTIFFYTVSDTYNYYMERVLAPYEEGYLERAFKLEDEKGIYYLDDAHNRPSASPRPNLCYEYKGFFPPHPSGWKVGRQRMEELDAAGELIVQDDRLRRKIRPKQGRLRNNLWDDIPEAKGKERLGYPTQKPLALLERIIQASSNPGDVVFDPFCGCATTIEAASALGRSWIGIDITIHAIRRVARARLQDRLHLAAGDDYIVEGVPRDWEGAHALWQQDPYQFQKWCVELVEGFVNVKRSADDGIDGRVYFDMPGEETLQCMALEVKGGENVSINQVRALSSVLKFEHVKMAGIIVLNRLGSAQLRNFQQTMALAGHATIGEREYPRIQLLTVDDILAGKRFDMPAPAGHSQTGYDRDLFNPPPGAPQSHM